MPRSGAISIYLSVLFLLTTGILFAGESADESKERIAPKAVFSTLKHDFGEVFEGVEIKYDFIVENRGSAPLVVKNIRPD